MRISRHLSLVDLAVLIVGAVILFLPPRPLIVVAAADIDEQAAWTLTAAEARALARPDDGEAAAELSRRLLDADLLDWAAEAPYAAAASPHPSRWKALLASSVAQARLLEVHDALAAAKEALAACRTSAAACPSFEQVRIELYVAHLEAGIRSGIDPKRDPEGFRKAGESGLLQIRVKTSTP